MQKWGFVVIVPPWEVCSGDVWEWRSGCHLEESLRVGGVNRRTAQPPERVHHRRMEAQERTGIGEVNRFHQTLWAEEKRGVVFEPVRIW